MADVNNRSDELKKEEAEEAPAEAATPEETSSIADVAAESDAEPDAAPDVPEGVNLIQLLIETQKEAQSNKDGWQRARAEFANYKKRIERERSELFQRASLDTLTALLPIIDDFDLAFSRLPTAMEDDPWIAGVAMIQRKFATLLERYEVEAIDPTGELFDPNLHQAIGTEESEEIESGHVSATLQKGYRAGDQVLRQALVKVAS